MPTIKLTGSRADNETAETVAQAIDRAALGDNPPPGSALAPAVIAATEARYAPIVGELGPAFSRLAADLVRDLDTGSAARIGPAFGEPIIIRCEVEPRTYHLPQPERLTIVIPRVSRRTARRQAKRGAPPAHPIRCRACHWRGLVRGIDCLACGEVFARGGREVVRYDLGPVRLEARGEVVDVRLPPRNEETPEP